MPNVEPGLDASLFPDTLEFWPSSYVSGIRGSAGPTYAARQGPPFPGYVETMSGQDTRGEQATAGVVGSQLTWHVFVPETVPGRPELETKADDHLIWTGRFGMPFATPRTLQVVGPAVSQGVTLVEVRELV